MNEFDLEFEIFLFFIFSPHFHSGLNHKTSIDLIYLAHLIVFFVFFILNAAHIFNGSLTIDLCCGFCSTSVVID